MKTLNSILSILFLASLGASAQKQPKKNIMPSAAAKAGFKQHFPTATKVKWEDEKGDYEVNFLEKGNEMSAVFDAEGTLKETESSIKTLDLPVPAINYLKQHYKGQKIKETALIKKADGSITYEAEINKKDLLFDASGKFIK